MNTLIIEPNSKADYQIFVSLAKRLNVTFREEKAKTKTKKEKTLLAEAALLKKQKEDEFFALAGSFDLPETADELINIIESSRTSKDIDISWID
ncbi:MAG: hypothetical protein MUF58_04755 [Arcicella sp.]|jgi:hypothetical protein|nr:hypothetical protein [Arcicella sp.]